MDRPAKMLAVEVPPSAKSCVVALYSFIVVSHTEVWHMDQPAETLGLGVEGEMAPKREHVH